MKTAVGHGAGRGRRRFIGGLPAAVAVLALLCLGGIYWLHWKERAIDKAERAINFGIFISLERWSHDNANYPKSFGELIKGGYFDPGQCKSPFTGKPVRVADSLNDARPWDYVYLGGYTLLEKDLFNSPYRLHVDSPGGYVLLLVGDELNVDIDLDGHLESVVYGYESGWHMTSEQTRWPIPTSTKRVRQYLVRKGDRNILKLTPLEILRFDP